MKFYLLKVNDFSEKLLRNLISSLNKFYEDAELGVNKNGFISRTLELFANSIYLNTQIWDLWICEENDDVKAYFLCSIEKGIDNNLCYTIHQGWISKELRGTQVYKDWWDQIKSRAKKLLCTQMVITSVRGSETYRRWLGEKNLTPYSELLHLNLEV